MDVDVEPPVELSFGSMPSVGGDFPHAGMKACMAAVSKIWRMTGPDFYFEMVDKLTPLQQGDFVITVVFHLKDRPKLVEVEESEGQKKLDMPELCSSFLISVAEQDEIELLTFQDTPNGEDVAPVKPRTRPVAFELFGDGSAVEKVDTNGIKWSFVTPNMEAMKALRVISASSFRHVYQSADSLKALNRADIMERCKMLAAATDEKFPMELVATNLDLLSNCLLLGIVPETLRDDFALALEDRALTKGFMTKEQINFRDPRRLLRMSKKQYLAKSMLEMTARLKPLHHLTHLKSAAHIGHLGIILEAGIIVGGSAYDAVYDPQNILKNAKRRSKLGAGSALGAAVGGAVGILIPIPGLFVLMSMAGSVAGKWIAGKFVTEDGVEHDDVVQMGRLRDDGEGVQEVTQELDEDDPQWMQVLNKVQTGSSQLWTSITGTQSAPQLARHTKDDLLSFETKDTPAAAEDSEEGSEEDQSSEIDLTSMKLLATFEAREIQRQSRRVKLAVFVEGLAVIAENTKLIEFFPMRVIKTWNAFKNEVFAVDVPEGGGILGWQTSQADEIAAVISKNCEELVRAREQAKAALASQSENSVAVAVPPSSSSGISAPAQAPADGFDVSVLEQKSITPARQKMMGSPEYVAPSSQSAKPTPATATTTAAPVSTSWWPFGRASAPNLPSKSKSEPVLLAGVPALSLPALSTPPVPRPPAPSGVAPAPPPVAMLSSGNLLAFDDPVAPGPPPSTTPRTASLLGFDEDDIVTAPAPLSNTTPSAQLLTFDSLPVQEEKQPEPEPQPPSTQGNLLFF